jgi:hypothetical protein
MYEFALHLPSFGLGAVAAIVVLLCIIAILLLTT